MPPIKTAQDLFAGLFTEATPEGLPQGASPRAINVDYIVGSVGPRPGKQSKFTYSDMLFDSTPAFTQSVGNGVPWSSGSVTLNQPGGGATPVFINSRSPFISSVVAGNLVTYTVQGFLCNLDGPIVAIWPIISQANVPPHSDGSDAQIVSIVDSVNGAWTQLTAPTSWNDGAPGPAHNANYQFFAQTFPAGTPGSWTVAVTFSIPVADLHAFNTPDMAMFQNCSGFDNYGFFKNGSGSLSPSGASITTSANRAIVSTANIAGVHSPPAGTFEYYGTGSPFTGENQAYFGSAGSVSILAAGTYDPAWSRASGLADVCLSTLALIPSGPTNCPNVYLNEHFNLNQGSEVGNTRTISGVVLGPAIETDDALFMQIAQLLVPNPAVVSQVRFVYASTDIATFSALAAPQNIGSGLNASAHTVWYGVAAIDVPAAAAIDIIVTYTGVAHNSDNQAGLVFVRNLLALDQTSSATGSSTSPVSGSPITFAQSEFLISFLDTVGGAFLTIPTSFAQMTPVYGTGAQAACFLDSADSIFAAPPGTYDPQWTLSAGIDWAIVNASLHANASCSGSSPSTGPISQTLQALNFSLDIPISAPQGQVATGCGDTFHFVPGPTASISGVEVRITGSQSDQSEDAELLVQLQLPDGTLSPEIKTAQLPLTTGTITLGSPTDLWGFTVEELNASVLDDPDFTVNIIAQAPGGEQVTFQIGVEVLVAFSGPAIDTNYLKSFAQTGGELDSLVLGSNGTMYVEDVLNNPDVLTPLFTRIFINNFAQSCTLDDREYIAVSNLKNGTDIPRVYSPPNFDRLSQEGPGAPPSARGSNAGGLINIVSITQPTVKGDPEEPGHISGFLWSAGPGSTQPGNVLTVYWGRSNPPGPSSTNDPDLVVGAGVTISGADTANPNNQFNGQPINGNYTITSVGEGVPPGAQFGRWYFTVQMAVSQFVNQADHIEANAPDGQYQVTTATLTAASPIPNMQIGSTMQIAGTGGSPPAGYDGSWTVTDTNNAAQLEITQTALTGNVATYSYILITGAAPVTGSKITVGNTLNGDGIFNVSNATITSASPGTFSISLVNPDVPPAAENGTGIVAGTIFKFEPGQPVGNKFGVGTVVVSGNFAIGQRKLCYSFLTRNGFLTRPSPIETVDIVLGSTGIAVSNLAIGPDNVVARVIHFTLANGGQFYNLPDPVIVDDPVTGQQIVNDSTWIMDNSTTSVVLSFSDETLEGGDEIDIQGNNLFACYELGSCTALVPYPGAARLAAIGEQNKVFNFRNHSFDGGIGGGGLTQTYPLGWTVDVANGAGGSVVPSPIFGSAFQIANASGSPQALYGMITQSAYKDEFQVDIINPSTTYSVRVTAACLAPIVSGNLVVDLYSASSGGTLGSFQIPLSSLTTTMQLFSGTLLTSTLAPVPQDLLLRIYATNIPTGATVILDREEVFPTEQPNLDTQVIFSYADNFEAFDRNTGVIKPAQNSQPIRMCFVNFDIFYMGKIGSTFSTSDNGTTEPVVAGGGWVIKTVSQSVGTTSVYGITTAIDQPNSGEDWAILAGRAGAYIYDGGEPIKLSEEIQSIWNQINWAYEHTIWTLNDIKNRRILFGVPLKTFWLNAQGQVTRGLWLPEGVIPDDGNPTTPNVVLELNYKQLNTAGALASSVGVHRSYSGKLLASEITRKWALWTIKAPAAAFLTRADNTAPVFVGNSDGNSKIFELVEGLLEDDGSPFAERYVTSPFLPRQQAQGEGVGVLRCGFNTMTMIIDGVGSFRVRAHPNYVDGPGSHDCLPDFVFPVSTWGDAECPLDEEANRLFIEFIAQCVNSAYNLSGLTMLMTSSGAAPYSGVNN